MADPYALLVACGTWPSPEVVQLLAGQAGQVIALDGALARCEEHALHADVLLGDMDSIKPEALAAFHDREGTVVEISASSTRPSVFMVGWRAQAHACLFRCLHVMSTP